MANTTPASLVPETTLQRLAPQREGIWFVTEQTGDHFGLAYVMDEGTHAINYQMFPCNTEEEAVEICGHLIYTYSGYDPVNVPSPSHGRENAPRPLHIVLRPRPQNPQGQGSVAQNTTGINQRYDPNQDHMAIGASLAAPEHCGPAVQRSLEEIAYQFTPTDIHGLNQQQMPVPSIENGNGNLDWAMANDSLIDMTLMTDNQNSQTLDGLFERNTPLGSMFNDLSSTSGDMTLVNGENPEQVDWNIFHEG
uniref:MAT1-2-2 n=1 Tax=Ophiocordyceps robertsii TaxID=169037 RepID=A0A8F2F3V5_9HYPO|nr:MAT1-2-2 [Ophiocordyceps robertsii]